MKSFCARMKVFDIELKVSGTPGGKATLSSHWKFHHLGFYSFVYLVNILHNILLLDLTPANHQTGFDTETPAKRDLTSSTVQLMLATHISLISQ